MIPAARLPDECSGDHRIDGVGRGWFVPGDAEGLDGIAGGDDILVGAGVFATLNGDGIGVLERG